MAEMGSHFFLPFCQRTFFLFIESVVWLLFHQQVKWNLIVTHDDPEVFAGMYSLKKVFLEISQNSLENTQDSNAGVFRGILGNF